MTAREQTIRDWLDHCRGCRRRSWEYLRNAWDDAAHGRVERADKYRKLARQQRRYAWGALKNARMMKGIAA